MAFKHTLLASSALLAASIGASAHAQTAPATNTIAELVVTAEKREQSLQDIPVAISAFTSEQRDIVGIQSIQDMTNFTPGLQYSTSTDRVSLRGLGRLTDERIRSFLADRLGREGDDDVRRALEWAVG